MKYFLYVKTSPNGLKYLGKTTKDPYEYMGSGKIWKRHLKKHNLIKDDIVTEILFETEDEERLIVEGLRYSEEFDIVKSKEWANLRPENGDGGDTSKFIDYKREGFRGSWSADHLNNFETEVDRLKAIEYRTSRINYNEEERLKKNKDNTDWETWRESVKNRDTDYSKFLNKVHEQNKKAITQLDLKGEIINKFNSAVDAGNELGLNISGIRNCLRGRTKTSGGFKWVYNEN